MHAPSIISLLVSGLAASTVAGWTLGTPGTGPGLACRSVALLAAAVGPALALPVDVAVEPRHHQGKGGKKKNNNKRQGDDGLEVREPHHQGKGGKKKNNNKRQEGEHDLEAREPHHQGKGGKKKNN
ncbi:hypothetical protein VPNG_03354 [Cytospora leucostoma]|uniref:Uncharacterized protein n=1 Tax=Cytospora leucostoma TaxID=1230097 RepID=A0A423XFR8_9PEZI|nr:hypothetical protein VPNG_03354 [Cytospora leucostoma]